MQTETRAAVRPGCGSVEPLEALDERDLVGRVDPRAVVVDP
jgi:hypothetical protein